MKAEENYSGITTANTKNQMCDSILVVVEMLLKLLKNEHITVVIDAFIKFCLLKAVQSTKAKYLIKFLEESFTHETPTRIIDDRGIFTSKEFQSFCKKYGYDKF